MKAKAKILIIDDEADIAVAIAESVNEVLLSLGIEGAFSVAEDENEVLLMIKNEEYDIISLDGLLRHKWHASPVIKRIFDLNSDAVIFSLSEGGQPTEDAKDFGLRLFFKKDYAGKDRCRIITENDLGRLRDEIDAKINHRVLCRDLIDPVEVFASQYSNSISSEMKSRNNCDLISEQLKANKIFFALINAYFADKICVSAKDLPAVKELAEKSGLEFWKI